MDLNWNQILVTFITACIPAIIAYFTASKQSKSQLQQVEKNNQLELDKLRLEYNLKLQEKESDVQNDIVSKLFTGDVDLEKLSESMAQLDSINKQAQKLNRSNFVKNRK